MKNYFPVPLHDFNVSADTEFLQEINTYLLEKASENIPMDDYSIRGQKSYHSDANLTRLDTEWSHKLRSLIVTSTQEYWNNSGNLFQAPPEHLMKIACWGMVMPKGGFSHTHNHPGADVCGVMWTQIPTDLGKREDAEVDEGRFVMLDPVYARRVHTSLKPNIDVHPQNGIGLVFPPWLEHFVEPHYSDEIRISLAWNVSFVGQP